MNYKTTETEPQDAQFEKEIGRTQGDGKPQAKNAALNANAPQTEEQTARQEPSGLKNPRVRQRLMIAGAILVAVILGMWLHYRNRQTTDDAEVDGHIIPISSRVPGSVVQVLVKDNEYVTKGQILVELDPRDYQAKVDDAKAALAMAQSRAQSANVNVPLTSETTQSGTSGADAGVIAAQAAYDQANLALKQASTSELAYAQANVQKEQAANDKAQSDLARMKPLAAKNEISQQQYDAYDAAATEAKSELDAAQQNLALAQQTIGVRQAQVESAQADLEKAKADLAAAQANTKQVVISSANASSAHAAVAQAQANLEAAELNLGYTKIVAPEDGVITNKTVQVGEILAPGQGLLVLIPLKDVWVTANYKETQLAKVQPGDRAEIYVDMYGKTFTGHVDSIAGATGSRLSLLPPENATGNYVKVVERIPVKIDLDPIPANEAILRPGMNVEATIITK
ncbi:MAG TPA: HlyD family secretion protein [Candidatus Acidoferrales bacterium]|nr:HlyD family secretion protein [Candidatus Acidoferrales bacterium]